MGKKAPRTALKLASDHSKIAELLLTGHSQADISRTLELDPSTVSRDVKLILKKMAARTEIAIDQYKVLQLEKLDKVEREAWQALERSKEAFISKVQRVEEGKGARVTQRTETRNADSRYMEIILRCIRQRCELLGIQQPASISVNVNLDIIHQTIQVLEALGEDPQVVFKRLADAAQARLDSRK